MGVVPAAGMPPSAPAHRHARCCVPTRSLGARPAGVRRRCRRRGWGWYSLRRPALPAAERSQGRRPTPSVAGVRTTRGTTGGCWTRAAPRHVYAARGGRRRRGRGEGGGGVPSRRPPPLVRNWVVARHTSIEGDRRRSNRSLQAAADGTTKARWSQHLPPRPLPPTDEASAAHSGGRTGQQERRASRRGKGRNATRRGARGAGGGCSPPRAGRGCHLDVSNHGGVSCRARGRPMDWWVERAASGASPGGGRLGVARFPPLATHSPSS